MYVIFAKLQHNAWPIKNVFAGLCVVVVVEILALKIVGECSVKRE